jgi:hypothetical protein
MRKYIIVLSIFSSISLSFADGGLGLGGDGVGPTVDVGKLISALGNLPKCNSPCTVAPVLAGKAFINSSGYVVIAQ